jgi:hypothetical protein
VTVGEVSTGTVWQGVDKGDRIGIIDRISMGAGVVSQVSLASAGFAGPGGVPSEPAAVSDSAGASVRPSFYTPGGSLRLTPAQLDAAAARFTQMLDAADAPRTLPQYADQVQFTLDMTNPKASVNQITLSDGRAFQGMSRFIDRGGVPNAVVQQGLDAVPLGKQAPWHGECGEIENLTNILDQYPEITTIEQAKELFRGASSESRFVRPDGDPLHGGYQPPCGTCKPLLKTRAG